jgi:hypothetical protein
METHQSAGKIGTSWHQLGTETRQIGSFWQRRSHSRRGLPAISRAFLPGSPSVNPFHQCGPAGLFRAVQGPRGGR